MERIDVPGNGAHRVQLSQDRRAVHVDGLNRRIRRDRGKRQAGQRRHAAQIKARIRLKRDHRNDRAYGRPGVVDDRSDIEARPDHLRADEVQIERHPIRVEPRKAMSSGISRLFPRRP